MKIAFISTMRGYRWGGSEELWHDAARTALAEGHEVLISTFRDFPLHKKITELADKGAKVFKNRPNIAKRLQALEGMIERQVFGVPQYTPARLRSPFRKLFQEKPDVICVSEGATYDVLNLPDLVTLLKDSEIPYMVTTMLASEEFFPMDEEKRVFLRDFYQKAFHFALVAKENLSLVERQLGTRMPNGIVLKTPTNLENTDLLPMPDSPTVQFGSVARLETFHKGQDILFESLGSPKWLGRDWTLNLHGDGEHGEHLKNLAAMYGISERVNFMGYAENVGKVWRQNHLNVMASRREGTPIAMIESMICGRPTVASDVGGISDWLKEPETGFIAEAPRAKYFEAALERAWQARAHWQKIGENAHRYALENISLTPGKDLLDLLTRKK